MSWREKYAFFEQFIEIPTGSLCYGHIINRRDDKILHIDSGTGQGLYPYRFVRKTLINMH